MKKILILTLTLSLSLLSFAQQKKGSKTDKNSEPPKYKVIDNDISDINYASVNAGLAVNLNGYNGGAGLGFGITGIVKSRVMVNANLTPLFLDRVLNNGDSPGNQSQISDYFYSKYESQHASSFNFNLVYNLSLKELDEEYRIILKSERTSRDVITHFYIPVNGLKSVARGIKLGYEKGYTQLNLNETDLEVAEVNNTSNIYLLSNSKNASTMYNFSNLRIGYSSTVISSIEVEVEGFGTKKESSFTNFYIDALVPMNRDIENMYGANVGVNVFSSTNPNQVVTQEYKFTDKNSKLPIGIAIGGATSGGLNSKGSLTFEAGLLPTYTKLLSKSYYFKLGFNLVLGKRF